MSPPRKITQKPQVGELKPVYEKDLIRLKAMLAFIKAVNAAKIPQTIYDNGMNLATKVDSKKPGVKEKRRGRHQPD